MIAFYHNNRLSGVIRACQIASYLGADLDPEDPNYSGVRVYVKAWPNDNWPSGSYLDVLDGIDLRQALIERKDLRPIVFTRASQGYLERYIGRKTVFIPQWHCNFENYIRPDREVRVVGFVGAPTSFEIDKGKFEKRLNSIGLEFRSIVLDKRRWKSISREDVSEFYKEIDIQIYYRPNAVKFTFRRFKDCLKLRNGGSFKIPTVGTRELNADIEFGGAYIPVDSEDELFEACAEFKKNSHLYYEVSSKAFKLSKPYHISNIAGLYNKLV